MSTKCAIIGCPNERRTRGWCTKHYQRWYHHNNPKAIVENHHGHNRPFTVSLWRKWHADREPGPETIRLREGIQEFRALLARYDVRRRR